MICCDCKLDLSETDFHLHARNKTGRNSFCKKCQSAYGKAWYARNKKMHKQATYLRKLRAKKENFKKLKEFFISKKCSDCGHQDMRVLEFDHLDPTTKTKHVSTLMGDGSSWAKILVEIEKCDIVCANCHRIRTQDRGQWTRSYW